METNSPVPEKLRKPFDPFRRAVVSGLAVLLPPLLTIVIFLWVANTVNSYLLEPMEAAVRQLLIRHLDGEIRTPDEVPASDIRSDDSNSEGRRYHKLNNRQLVPGEYYDYLVKQGVRSIPDSADEFIQEYVSRKFLTPYIVIPAFLCVFLLFLYLLGKFLAAGIGRIFWIQFERIINRLPLVRHVYSSVKQVTDFMFNEKQLEAARVVAVEYPRKGMWSLAFVTGESILDIRIAANEPVLSVLIPTSPMPFAGFTATVRKSETIDLDITMDQALQFLMSCGVVVPPQQLAEGIGKAPRLSSES